NHLGGVVEEVAVALFAFAQGVLGAAGRAEVDGDRDEALDGSGGGAHGGEVDHGREGAAVAAAVAHFKSAHAAGGESCHVADIGKESGGGVLGDFKVGAE